MSLASTSLCSSPPLPKTGHTKQNPTLLFSQSASAKYITSSNNWWSNSNSISLCNTQLVKQPSIFVVKAAESQTGDTQSEGEENEEYEVELDQPYGLKFAKGRDGGTYIDAIAPGGSAGKTGLFTVGDKVVATSAVFGTEIWPAAEYGRTMYTIRQRIGPLLMKMQKRYGKMDSTGELTDKEILRAERNSGVISKRVRDIQMQNYLKKMEQKQQREKDLREGLQLYKSQKYEEALEKFESVLGSKPEQNEAAVASYNVACCYSKLNQIQAGLSALEDAMKEGYEDFKRIRTDPDLANLRASENFEPLLNRIDQARTEQLLDGGGPRLFNELVLVAVEELLSIRTAKHGHGSTKKRSLENTRVVSLHSVLHEFRGFFISSRLYIVKCFSYCWPSQSSRRKRKRKILLLTMY